MNQLVFKTTIIAAAAVFTALFAYWCIPPLIANTPAHRRNSRWNKD